ncbi:MAG: hypothetical protein ACQGVK_18855 [Myxococcota bacterium]
MRISPLTTSRRRPLRGLWVGIAISFALFAAGTALAADGIVLGGKSQRQGPTAAELAERAQAERESLEKRAAELAEQEKKLRQQAAAEAEAARTACPPLTTMKYPWIRCSSNEWGGKELSVPGSGHAEGVVPMLRERDS